MESSESTFNKSLPSPKTPALDRLISARATWAQTLLPAAIGVAVILGIGFMLRKSDFDLPIVRWFNESHTGAYAAFTDSVYNLLEPLPALVLAVVICLIVLFVSRSIKIASTFASTAGVSWLSLIVVKALIHRERPSGSGLPNPFDPAQTDASYPSGHTAYITAIVITLLLGVSPGITRWITGVIGAFLVLGIAIVLLTDGVHFPSDILASVIWVCTIAPLARKLWTTLVLRVQSGAPTPTA